MKARRNLDLQLPACLDALITECSVTQAAERIGMSQPAISMVWRGRSPWRGMQTWILGLLRCIVAGNFADDLAAWKSRVALRVTDESVRGPIAI